MKLKINYENIISNILETHFFAKSMMEQQYILYAVQTPMHVSAICSMYG